MRKTAVLAVLLAAPLTGLSPLAQAGDIEKGKQVFTQEAQPSCTVCHTLADAGSAGAIGPNLDELKPSREQVINAVTGGVGIMPAFSEFLSSEQIRAVAHYVARATGGDK
ncbi:MULTISPECIES: cytochrome c [Marinobacter]|uniref:Cytochrome c n=1 Tax=Marinobacter metalliresistant TaxID=2961995 RepID=A0ABZ2VWQ6_9GAMM|nr:cytochrome c [Marinobacter sp. Arc7-DN-1]AXS83293.1 cytochrome c [Marinobacter sp. Arc7-DN-1]